MSLFGNRELQELRAELERAVSRAEKAQAELKAAVRRADAAEAARAAAEESAQFHGKAVAELRRENERLNESRANAEKAASYFEQRCCSSASEVEAAKRELESARLLESSARALEVHVKGENARLKSENESLSARLEKSRQTVNESGPAAAGGDSVDDVRLLRAEVEDLRRRLAESDEMRRVAVRKAEHNRRAWLITQMQLDLAEDRLCLITTGRPRPVLDEGGTDIDSSMEEIQAEDVDGGDEVGAAAVSADPE